ncbi:MAG: hypothetical protein AAFP90_04640, partial [Planctomycetota bacterium]
VLTAPPLASTAPGALAANGPATGDGNTLFNQGLKALSAGDKSGARALFRQAWQFESTMDPTLRRQLKEKLTLLQPRRLPAPKPGTATPLGMAGSAVPSAEMEAAERLYREVTAEMIAANNDNEDNPLNAQKRLEKLAEKISKSEIQPAAKASMTRMVQRALDKQMTFIETNKSDIEMKQANAQVRAEMDQEQKAQLDRDAEISELVDTYNKMMKERRYAEANVIAKKVHEIFPGSEIDVQMTIASRTAMRNLIMTEDLAQAKDDTVWGTYASLEEMYNFNPQLDLEYDRGRWEDVVAQRSSSTDDIQRESEYEKRIRAALMKTVSVNYSARPLTDVLDAMQRETKVPIVLDRRSMLAANINTEAPVSLEIPGQIPLQSALRNILDQYDLTYSIENDVLKITTREAARSRTYTLPYPVRDLVIPIPNFPATYDMGLGGALRQAYQMTSGSFADIQLASASGPGLVQNQKQGIDPSVLAQVSGSMMGAKNPLSSGAFDAFGGQGGASLADFSSLMQLIQTTIEPDIWLGDQSSMQPYPQNLSLVVNTTSDVHDQIAQLLESLRQLQNLQVTIEVRFINLSDLFFEQIGVDFDVDFDDNLTSNPEDDAGPSVAVGLSSGLGATGIPTPTVDFDFSFRQNNNATPQFGGFQAGQLATFGFAILSDIETFFFLQAAQADQRTNVLQAPKVTLYDGQLASISDVTQRPFVISIVPVVGDFAVAQQPVIVVLNEGTQLNVQAVVSDDKRFVRMTLVPFFSQIGDVNQFTFTGRRTTSSDQTQIDPNTGNVIQRDDVDDVIEGTTVQLPSFASTTVSTTVNVPDGGTILLGGIKRLAEGRTESGVPILSKIPYVSRLFRNVGIGREARSLMLMVTPRIIIQEEEEIRQTGFDARQY